MQLRQAGAVCRVCIGARRRLWRRVCLLERVCISRDDDDRIAATAANSKTTAMEALFYRGCLLRCFARCFGGYLSIVWKHSAPFGSTKQGVWKSTARRLEKHGEAFGSMALRGVLYPFHQYANVQSIRYATKSSNENMTMPPISPHIPLHHSKSPHPSAL
jgi:hypothetical protein